MDFIAENSHDHRKLFRASKRLLNCSSRDEGLPPNLDAPTFANNLGKYFVTKVQMIQQKVVNDASLPDVTSSSVTDTVNSNTLLSTFEKLSDSDVKSFMRRSTLKTCCPLNQYVNVTVCFQFCYYNDHQQISAKWGLP